MPPHPVLKWERNGNCPAVRQGAMSRGAEVAPLRRPRDGGQHRPQKLAVSSDGTRAPGQPRRSGEGGRGAPPRRRPNALGHTGAGSVLPARCQRSKPRNHHGHRAAPAAPPPPSLPAESPGVVGAVLCACSVAGASARPGAEADRSPGPSRGSRAGRVRQVAVRHRHSCLSYWSRGASEAIAAAQNRGPPASGARPRRPPPPQGCLARPPPPHCDCCERRCTRKTKIPHFKFSTVSGVQKRPEQPVNIKPW